ncbi:hypothetical protein J6590_017290 [Homalodisca vitripennis]|nr:hypothetical protein J6590_017290 [Homalodisca vitripennis]
MALRIARANCIIGRVAKISSRRATVALQSPVQTDAESLFTRRRPVFDSVVCTERPNEKSRERRSIDRSHRSGRVRAVKQLWIVQCEAASCMLTLDGCSCYSRRPGPPGSPPLIRKALEVWESYRITSSRDGPSMSPMTIVYTIASELSDDQ